jgi:hypothetical protein
VALCTLVGGHQPLGGAYCLHLRIGVNITQIVMDIVTAVRTSNCICIMRSLMI